MTSHLDAPERHPVRPLASVAGPVAVVAPHPDDESLACGGLLASLAAAGVPARVVVVTDGAGSHPNSQAYPPDRLRALRQAETVAALDALGLGADAVRFLGLPDGALADLGEAIEAAVAALADALAGAATVFAPWDGDPHPDHIATAMLAESACARLDPAPRRVAYPVWAWVRGDLAPTEGTPWRLDVSAARDRKRRAVAAHRSQTTTLIDDDPDGFVLSPDVLARFDRDWELFWDL
ncbi:PIG-L deacetylase family protein [Rubrivirga sp.]|uniref:PIG-L deacetylase family protein n=1 Tax=Rubrivirga sp. TaxID=1885344 RepID=UPI003B526192